MRFYGEKGLTASDGWVYPGPWEGKAELFLLSSGMQAGTANIFPARCSSMESQQSAVPDARGSVRVKVRSNSVT